MDNLTSQAMLAVSLIVVGSILGVYMVVLGVGMSSYSMGMQKVNVLTELSDGSGLDSLASYSKALPAATVYIQLSKYEKYISSISGSAYGVTVTTLADVELLLKKKIRCQVYFENNMYRVVISP